MQRWSSTSWPDPTKGGRLRPLLFLGAVLALLLKLTLAPALVAAATHVARRLGHRAGGLVSGLPLIAAPIVLIYAVEHGNDFARAAAASAVLGIISSVAFCVVYALVARRASAPPALAASCLAFAAVTLTLSRIDSPLAVSGSVTLVVIGVGSWLVVRLVCVAPAARPRADLLPLRLGITVALVVTITAAAGGLSAHLAGLLVPLPIITAVMAGFTHARTGAPAAIEFLGGLVPALSCFLAFFVTLAAFLPIAGAGAAFGFAVAATLACWAALAVASGALVRSGAA